MNKPLDGENQANVDAFFESRSSNLPKRVSDLGHYLQENPQAQIQVVEVATGNKYLVKQNGSGDVCVQIGKSLKLLEGREDQFVIDMEAKFAAVQIPDEAEKVAQAKKIYAEIRGERTFTAAEILTLLHDNLGYDLQKAARRTRLQEEKAHPRQHLVRIYRTILNARARNLVIYRQKIVNSQSVPKIELTLSFSWFHENEYEAKELHQKLEEMGCKAEREKETIWFEMPVNQSDLDYVIRNTGIREHLAARLRR